MSDNPLNGKAYLTDEINCADINRAIGKDPSLPLHRDALRSQQFDGFFEKTQEERTDILGDLKSVNRTYNKLIIEINPSRNSLLFIRDSFFPFWKADINGGNTPVLRTLGIFKGVVVSAGHSVVCLRFSPPWVGPSLLIAYLTILANLIKGFREKLGQD